MTASLDLPKVVTKDHGRDNDPEMLGKVDNELDTPVEDDQTLSEKGPSPWEVTLEKSEDPKTMAAWSKWAAVFTVSFGAMCVTCASTMVGTARRVHPHTDLTSPYAQAAFAEEGTMKEFGVSRTVAILPVSLFLMGLGTGPLLVGPLSEVYGALSDFHSSIEHRFTFSGRSPVYLGSFAGYFVFSWPIAFAPNIGTCYLPPITH